MCVEYSSEQTQIPRCLGDGFIVGCIGVRHFFIVGCYAMYRWPLESLRGSLVGGMKELPSLAAVICHSISNTCST